MEPCAEPVLLPADGMTQGEADAFWIEDRFALINCGKDHAALVEWVELTLDAYGPQ